jgi:group I intron endonuclease
MSIGIYKITNLINGKCYIGQSINIEKRWGIYKSNVIKLINKYPLDKSFIKYGIKNFSFEIIKECPKENLNCLEQFFIRVYNSYYKFGFGYNMTLGGQGTIRKQTSEERNLRSKIMKGKNKGKHWFHFNEHNIFIHGNAPQGYILGKSDSLKLKDKLGKLGKPGNALGKHWTYSKESRTKLSECKKGKKWFTNRQGINVMKFECPVGFYPGYDYKEKKMKKLREIDGDNEKSTPSNDRVKLDGREISATELEEAKKDQAVRIIETNPNEHKTLQHLR